MAALAMMKAKDRLVGFQVEVYEDATVDVPLTVLAEAVSRLMRTPDVWRPDPGTLLASCEAIRLELRNATKFEHCARCSIDGWAETTVDGVKRMERCQCWTVHQQKVAALGGGAKPLALPAPREGEWTQAGDAA